MRQLNWTSLWRALAPAALLSLSSFAAAQSLAPGSNRVELSGVRGGPFDAESGGAQTLTLINSTGSDAQFEAVLGAAWLHAEPAKIKLRAGDSAQVRVSIDPARGAALDYGQYEARLAWFDLGSGQTTAEAKCSLHLAPLPARLVVTENVAHPGHYRLENEGDLGVTVQVRVDAPWAWVEGPAE
ncbi:MAG: hypothetical protein AAF368_19060, partial [Planctomycetota bacterium]